MPRRKLVLANDEYYHVYNRSTGGISLFEGGKTLNRTLSILNYYRYPQRLRYSKFLQLATGDKQSYEESIKKQKPIVEVYAFCLMPTHYHLLLKQNSEGGIRKYVANLQNSFAKYFNLKSDRHGVVFQGPFKSKHIENEDYLLHVSRYIHLNPVTSYQIEISQLSTYLWTSFPSYVDNPAETFVNHNLLKKIAGSGKKYRDFVSNQSDYQRKLAKIKHLI